ncbi:unnamed protein product, partial [Brachionus calyciflorus]
MRIRRKFVDEERLEDEEDESTLESTIAQSLDSTKPTSSRLKNSRVDKNNTQIDSNKLKLNKVNCSIKAYSSQEIDLTEDTFDLKNNDLLLVKAFGLQIYKTDLELITS